MRKLTRRLALLAAFLCLGVAQGFAAAPKYSNNPLPHRPDTLKILAIGNSFSDDGTEYLPELLEAAGIHNVVLGRLYIGGCTLERHCREYNEDLHDYRYDVSTDNKWVTVKSKAGILDGIGHKDWDIITMQQASGVSGIYGKYQPYLEELIGIVREHCSNPDAAIVWHETWAYATTSSHGEFPNYHRDQLEMIDAIRGCVHALMRDCDIRTVIPCGEAVQAARNNELNTELEMTRDGFHLDKQCGRYLAACTWFEALIRPTLGKSVKGNKATLQGTPNEITPEQARLCQKTARKAVKKVRRWPDR